MITKTWGATGTYTTLGLAINSLTFPLTDNVTLNQVGDSVESAPAWIRNVDLAGKGITVNGNLSYGVTIGAYFTSVYNCSNIGYLVFNNLNITNINYANSCFFLGSNTSVAGAYYTLSNIFIRGVSNTTVFSIVPNNGENTNVRKITLYNIVVTGNNGTSPIISFGSGVLAYNNITIDNVSILCTTADSIDVNSACTVAVKNSYLGQQNNTTRMTLTNCALGTTYSYINSFDNYSDYTQTSFLVPKQGSYISSAGSLPSAQAQAAGMTRYKNLITFTSAAPTYQIGAMGLPIALTPPGSFAASPGSDAFNINLSWTPTTSADGYLIYRTTSGTDLSYFESLSPIATITSGSASSYTDSDPSLSDTTDYYYRVRSYRNS